jgi:hypothetical protein
MSPVQLAAALLSSKMLKENGKDFVCAIAALDGHPALVLRGTWQECERAYNRVTRPQGGIVYITSTRRLKNYLFRIAIGRGCSNHLACPKAREIGSGKKKGRSTGGPFYLCKLATG